jgi:hypothetical protein
MLFERSLMSSKEVFLKGKAKWARVSTPDPWGHFKITLYPDSESISKFKELKVKNTMKRDEDGDYLVLRRPVNKTIRGKVVGFAPPTVVDSAGMPLRDVLIGNGSDVTVKLIYYSYMSPQKEPGFAIRLEAVRVDNLVPFTPKRDFEADEVKAMGTLNEQPAPNF